MSYAENTTVPVAKTRGEIEALLEKFKASQYATAHDHEQSRATVQFKVGNRIVRFTVKLPKLEDYAKRKFSARQSWKSATDAQKVGWMEQDTRQRWRALLLVLKAKLESIDSGIATFEEEFLAHIVLPNDQTVAEVILPRIAQAYDAGVPLLPAIGGTS